MRAPHPPPQKKNQLYSGVAEGERTLDRQKKHLDTACIGGGGGSCSVKTGLLGVVLSAEVLHSLFEESGVQEVERKQVIIIIIM